MKGMAVWYVTRCYPCQTRKDAWRANARAVQALHSRLSKQVILLQTYPQIWQAGLRPLKYDMALLYCDP
jgi:hypothetical protein